MITKFALQLILQVMLEYTKLMYKAIHVLKLIENVKIIMEKLNVRIYMQEPIKDVFYLMVIMNLIIKYVTILQNKVNGDKYTRP